MPNNVEELLVEAEKMQGIEAKTKLIMNYFLENVRYNYAYLFTKGYAQGTISAVSSHLDVTTNKTRVEGDEEFSITRSVLQGESQIFNDILRIRDENSGSYKEFIEKLRTYITVELRKHLGNDNLVSENVDTVMKRIEQGLRKKAKIHTKENGYYAYNYDISMVLIDFLLQPKKYFPPEFKNGVISNGVCEDYTNYLVPLLQKAGIEAHGVEGTSELGHAWIIIKDEEKYKSVDLTRAVFIRDGFLGIPAEQTSEDWLYSDLEDIFRMQETRSIMKIDGKKLPQVINGQNYDEDSFIRMMEEQAISDSTFANHVRNGLDKGVTSEEVSKAEKVEEPPTKREEQANE